MDKDCLQFNEFFTLTRLWPIWATEEQILQISAYTFIMPHYYCPGPVHYSYRSSYTAVVCQCFKGVYSVALGVCVCVCVGKKECVSLLMLSGPVCIPSLVMFPKIYKIFERHLQRKMTKWNDLALHISLIYSTWVSRMFFHQSSNPSLRCVLGQGTYCHPMFQNIFLTTERHSHPQ